MIIKDETFYINYIKDEKIKKEIIAIIEKYKTYCFLEIYEEDIRINNLDVENSKDLKKELKKYENECEIQYCLNVDLGNMKQFSKKTIETINEKITKKDSEDLSNENSNIDGISKEDFEWLEKFIEKIKIKKEKTKQNKNTID
ncbi:MAG: hypothetical protein ACRC4M_02620 [Mycoplasma sp.]